MTLSAILQHRFIGRGLVLLGAALLFVITKYANFVWILGVIAILLAVLPEKTTSRSVYGLYGIFLWSLSAMELHRQFGSIGQLGGVLILYLASTLLVHTMTSLKTLRSWVMAQAIGITLAETFLILLFWPVNFPTQALMITAIGFLGFEIIQHAHTKTLSLRQLSLPLTVVTVAIIGTTVTTNWLEY